MNYELKSIYDSFSFDDVVKNKNYRLAKCTLLELISHSDTNGVTFVSIRTIANNLCKTTTTIMNHIKILEDLKIVENLNIKGNFGKSSYRKINLNVPVDVPVDVLPNVLPNVPVDVLVANTEYNRIEYNRIEEDINATANASTIEKEQLQPNHSDMDKEDEMDMFFEDIWKTYTLDFINKKSGRKDTSKGDAKKNFKKVIKHKFKNIDKEYIFAAIVDYINDTIEYHNKKEPTYASNLKKILTIDSIQDYINQVQG